MSSTWRIIWTLAVALAVGCSPDPLEAPRGEPVALKAELPVVDPAALEEPWETLQVEVTEDTIRLSVEPECRRWQRDVIQSSDGLLGLWVRSTGQLPPSRQQLEDTFKDTCGTSAQETVAEIVALDDGRIDTGQEMIIEPLYDKLVAVTEQKKRFHQLANLAYRPQLLVAADNEVAFETLFKVIYTAGQVEISHFGFLVEPSHPPADPGDPPKMFRFDTPELTCCGPDPPHVAHCADVSVQMTNEGLFAHLLANSDGVVMEGAGPWGRARYTSAGMGFLPRDSEWVDADGESVMWHDTSLGDGCPPVAKTANGYDVGALAELLDDFDEVEYCGQVDLRVHHSASSITAGDLMEAASAIRTLEPIKVLLGPGYTEHDIDCEAPAGEGPDAEDAEGAERQE